LRTIRRCGPVLVNMPATRANLAVYFPDAHEFIEDGYDQPDYTLAMLKGTFGDTDVHREEIIIETGEIPYDGLVLLRAKWIHAKAVPILRSWIEAGGILVTDGLPERTHRDQPIEWGFPQDLTVTSGGVLPFAATLAGRGRIITLNTDVENLLKKCCEAKVLDPVGVRLFRLALRDILDTCLTPNVRAEYAESATSVDTVEAMLRGNAHGMLLTVVNHLPEPREVTVTVRRPDIAWLVDMETLEAVSITDRNDEVFTLKLTVPGRWARMIAGYQAKPNGVKIRIAERTLAPGDKLVYTVQVKKSWRGTLEGGALLHVNAFNPDGRPVSRFSCKRAPTDGFATFATTIPMNAQLGKYTLEAVLPQTGSKARATFRVKSAN
ncbi:MAG: hypothetical protein KAI66_21195, partial [Lentisphaeria bacterium]|nr:hypothetical protein [Lentisphaeria bacterium]